MKKLLCVSLLLLSLFGCTKRIDQLIEDGKGVVFVTVSEDSTDYSVPAVEGEVIVLFNPSVSEENARRILEENGATVISQLQKSYFLVHVETGQESQLISRLQANESVYMADPNAIEVVDAARPYVLDNFLGTHGERVVAMVQGCNPDLRVETFNTAWGDGGHVSDDRVNTQLDALLSQMGSDESMVINMSFGPPLESTKGYNHPLWTDKNVLDNHKTAYKRRYVNRMKQFVRIVAPYDNKDFVITKSSGNTGMKQFEQIISQLQQSLSPAERAVLERHFVFVSAKDDYSKRDYPNDVSNGGYDRMVSKVDISDMTEQSSKWHGTSFSTPRLAGCIIDVANNSNLSVTSILEYVRTATQNAPDHVLSCDMLHEEAQIQYTRQGVLLYRLMYDDESGLQYLQLVNTTNYPIRVRGVLLNAIASHGGENTIEFDETVNPGEPKIVDGFVENKCKIYSVTELGRPSEDASAPAPDGLSAEQVARRFGIALTSGDLATVRALTTAEFYQEVLETYPVERRLMTDKQRNQARKAFAEAPASTIRTGENRVVVRFNRNGRKTDYYLRYQDGGWKVSDFAKGGVHVPRSMRKQMRKNNGY